MPDNRNWVASVLGTTAALMTSNGMIVEQRTVTIVECENRHLSSRGPGMFKVQVAHRVLSNCTACLQILVPTQLRSSLVA